MLDDLNVISQRDPKNALGVAAEEWQQLTAEAIVENQPANFTPAQIVIAGMGGSALAAGMAKNWLELPVPFEICRRYELPHYVSEQTLVIASSYSGNTEETLSALKNARLRGAQIAVLASGGRLVEIARERQYPLVVLPKGLEPRMAVLYNLRALVKLFGQYRLAADAYAEIAATSDWLKSEISNWLKDIPTEDNLAKQLALKAVGKTPVIYAGALMAPIAYKWKISFNENAKNVAFWNELPEFNHNEFIGWTSHPVEKPFAVFDLVSSFEHPQVQKRFMISDSLLSGKRPHAITVPLNGESPLAQMLWGSVLGDFVSIYTAILNNVDPTPVALIEKLKIALTD
ncbi:MAG TPA: bifunctional phosphoglucose/phosphomannose isomerase [Verrucomicrobiae bacterium]|nr:bifunctional phosphoglucose/phosphomannose isomerase [Verrucomicrobiae bacterium]